LLECLFPRRNYAKLRETQTSPFACDVPLFKKQFDQLDQLLGFVRFNINDHVNVGFHMGADIANAADMINRVNRIGLYAGRRVAVINPVAQLLDFINESLF